MQRVAFGPVFAATVLFFVLGTYGCRQEVDFDRSQCGPGPASASCRFENQCWDLECRHLQDDGSCPSADSVINKDKETCEVKLKGVWSTNCPCSLKDTIGGCKRGGDDPDRKLTTWIYGGMTTEEYQKVCEMSVYNTFLPPPSN
ncbi:MAG TPA: hypothetical protein PK329_01810 [Myxococcota bacterium]|nr:hypothetical protein [Myxococcota bacterium]HON24796.1 hypothetical protein [Myxococcota bacterium]HOS61158.1 hypothetical protein [Myxococcota bacterium]HPC91081.1 hypothetical protein [Myxococcota bacterium]HPL24556.1 hypothetical protein [Myxococcota bacterium]